ncbi:VanZ family protein [Novosphingobium sp.]|uniref:VanZ family protein n=1 Tax=Novosphingobium sp. TaxID=1874826 RepID=UPI002632952D|nr:VanZ family protein [Novosphingobium sp.]
MLKALETLSRLARLLFWPALIFALVMAVLPQPPQLPMTDMGDKVQHMLAFFTLTLLAGTGWPRLALVRALLALSLVGAGIELVQAIPALHRTADWRDWMADTAAICAGLVPVAVFRHLLEQRSTA